MRTCHNQAYSKRMAQGHSQNRKLTINRGNGTAGRTKYSKQHMHKYNILSFSSWVFQIMA